MESIQHLDQRATSNASTSASSALTSTSASPQMTPTPAQANSSSFSAFKVPSMQPPSTAPSIPPSNVYQPNFPQFSAATEEILKRVSANATAGAGTAGWEAAREQVLKSMVTSDTIAVPSSGNTVGTKRGRGGSKMPSPLRPAPGHAGYEAPAQGTAGPEAAQTPVELKITPASGRGRGRGGGRGRGRGGGRGGKRKAGGSDDSENDSDISSSYTPLPTRTKSGRNVQKPTTFSPALPSESSGTKRRRVSRKGPEATVCSVCLRGHSPASNLIVFCDVCNTPYHQFCHDPPIDKEVVTIAEKEWFCGRCKSARENANLGIESRVSGEDLTLDERRAYFSTLPSATLVSLLVHATTVHPSLPVFPPDAKPLLQPAPAPAIDPSSTATSESTVTQPPSNGYTMNHSTSSTSHPSHTPAPDTNTSSQPQDYPSQHHNQHPPLSVAYPNSLSSHFNIHSHPPPPHPTPPTLQVLQNQQQPQPQHPPSSPHHQQPLRPPPSANNNNPSPDADGEPDQDHYDGYDTDPPAHYVKAGNGVAGKLMRPESDDLQWLVDDNFSVFSHTVRDPVDGRYVPVGSMGGVGRQWGVEGGGGGAGGGQ